MAQDSPDEGPESQTDQAPRSGKFSWQRAVGFIGCLLAAGILLQATEPASETSIPLTAQVAVRGHTSSIQQKLSELGATDDSPLRATLTYRGPESAESAIESELDKLPELELVSSAKTQLAAHLRPLDGSREVDLRLELRPSTRDSTQLLSSTERTGGWIAILPPLVAVLAALFFRRLVAALLGAVWLGAALQTGFAPLAATWMTLRKYLWGSVANAFNLYIIGFTFCLVGMVHVIIRMGGIAGILKSVSSLAQSARSTRIATVLMGLALFFDDYANTIVVGTTMRPMTDRRRVSREKLAYLVDSTSAPIAGIAVISTWIGYEVGLFEELSRQLQLGMSGYGIFFEILSLRFYCILTLVFVFANAVTGRDFGPMLTAERRAVEKGEVLRPDATPLSSDDDADVEPRDGIPHRWFNAAIPVGLVIVSALLGMYWSGWSAPSHPDGIPGLYAVVAGGASTTEFFDAWLAALPGLYDWEVWRSALSNAANAKILFVASVLGSLTAIGLAVGQDLLDLFDATHAWSRTIPMMVLAVAILVLAWAIQSVCTDLGTSIYLVGAVQHLFSARALPILTFGLAAVVAFATGTSWGTMGILLPAMIPLAYHATADLAHGELVLFMCFGAVLDGAIFGDHCSPISDTTVMSSIASSSDHLDHVRTQFPYAMTSMAAAAGFGYCGVAFGLPVLVAYGLGALSLVAVLFAVGTTVTRESSDG